MRHLAWVFLLAAATAVPAPGRPPVAQSLRHLAAGKIKLELLQGVGPIRRAGPPVVVLDTSLGPVHIELFEDKAPETVRNFLRYVDGKFYDGTIYHRVIPNFMIQGGGFVPGMAEKSAGAPVRNESANGLSNARGTVAVARAAAPDSGTSQFFINLKDNQVLDRARSADQAGYCVFGRVVVGMDVVDRIAGVPTRQVGQYQDVPAEDVVIRSARRLAAGPALAR